MCEYYFDDDYDDYFNDDWSEEELAIIKQKEYIDLHESTRNEEFAMNDIWDIVNEEDKIKIPYGYIKHNNPLDVFKQIIKKYKISLLR